ncbi:MAG: FadR family transcriptional regulator [Chloroflexi bacterium]|nr:FadR family transcriptional regulator [Chloroflexota bacterium]
MASAQDLLTPVKQQKVYTQIVDQFLDLIERGEFKPGMQLPAERDLARYLGISRASLREALTVLQLMGLVETLSGQGTFIRSKPISPFFHNPALMNVGESPFIILQARKALEPSIAALAATHSREVSSVKLREVLDWIDSDHSAVQVMSDVFSEGDRQFHLEIAHLTDNSVLINMQQMIHYFMGQKLWLTLMRHTSFTTPGRWQEAHDEHHGIFEAIQNHDGQLASSRVRTHLLRVEKIMIQAELISNVPGDETLQFSEDISQDTELS